MMKAFAWTFHSVSALRLKTENWTYKTELMLLVLAFFAALQGLEFLVFEHRKYSYTEYSELMKPNLQIVQAYASKPGCWYSGS